MNETFQTKIQAFIKDKEDLSSSFQHVEGKLQKVEMDREQLKLKSNQQKEQLEAQAKFVLGEAQGSWLQRNWRPLLLGTFAGLVW